MRIAITLLLALVTSSTTYPDQEVVTVFLGIPDTRLVMNCADAEHIQISGEEAAEYATQIVMVNGRLYWANRDMRPMTASRSGSFITYHTTDGQGYVKIADPSLEGIAAMADERFGEHPNGGHTYLEHITNAGFHSFLMYWGTTATNSPPPGV